MRTVSKILFYIFFSASFIDLNAQTLTHLSAQEFIDFLISSPSKIKQSLIEKDFHNSDRLGISYFGIEPKFLISHDLSDSEKDLIRSGNLEYRYQINPLEDGFSKLELQLNNQIKTKKEFYFWGDSLISSISYYTKNWQSTDSKYFRFYSENPNLINAYSINKLDDFVDHIALILQFDESMLRILQKEKILYVFCESEQMMQKITGYTSRGQYNVAYDAIITTYNAHFHEVAHLLINYKLKMLNIYTHPFLQEGLAVALGGRGGLNKEPLFTFADFSLDENFVEVKQLVNPIQFGELPPSISYPVSGFLVKALLEKEGIEYFLGLYKLHSSNKFNDLSIIDQTILESLYMDSSQTELIEIIYWKPNRQYLTEVTTNRENQIFQDEEYYYFSISDTSLIQSSLKLNQNYRSKKFGEIFGSAKYSGNQYLIIANDFEIGIYDLFTNQLLTNYVIGFQKNPIPTRPEDGNFTFKVLKKVFDKPLVRFVDQN